MSEENKAVVRRMLDELFNRGELDLVDEIMAPDFVMHNPNFPKDLRGPEEFEGYVSAHRLAFPDIRIEVEDHLAEGDRVATRWTVTGTHEGVPRSSIASDGKKRVKVAGMDISRISGGKIAEIWSNFDALGMMRQLGVIPPSGPPREAGPT